MDPQRFTAYVADLEREAAANPAAFRRRVLRLIALGYAYVFAILLALIAMMAGAIAVLVIRRRGALFIQLLIPVSVLAYYIVRSLWESREVPDEEVLDPKSAPRLVRRVEEIRRTLKAPRISRIVISREFNASMGQIRRFGVLGAATNRLEIGLPLMYGLGPREFDALLGHEIAHISNARPKYSQLLHHVSDTWQRLLSRLNEANAINALLFERFARWYIPRLDAHELALRRRDEFEADADAARVTSRDTAARLLASLTVRHERYDAFWARIGKRVEHEPAPPAVQWTELPPTLVTDPEDPAVRVASFAAALRADKAVEHSHPSFRERLDALGALKETSDPERLLERLVPPLKTTSADYYLGAAAAAHLKRFEKEFVTRNAEAWRASHDEAVKARKAADAFAARDAAGETLTIDELFEWATIVGNLDAPADAIAMHRRVIEREPNHVSAHFLLGQALIGTGDGDGAEHLERAMQLDEECTPAAAGILREFYAQTGNAEALRATEVRAHERMTRLREIARDRSEVLKTDKLAAPGLSKADLALVANAARLRGVRTIWIASKVTKHPSKRLLIIVHVHARPGFFGLSESRRTALANEVHEQLQFGPDRDVLVSVAAERLKWLEEKVRAARGIRATRKRVETLGPLQWHQKHRRALVIGGLGVGLVAFAGWLFYIPQRIYDNVAALNEFEVTNFNAMLQGIQKESGVDIRVVVDTVGAQQEISQLALERARQLGVGRTTDRRGLLLFIDRRSGALRLEVGPQLEGIFPDGFVGRVLRAHTAPVLGAMPIRESLVSTLKLLHHRIREAAMRMEYDPTKGTAILDSVRLAAGAGATFSGTDGTAEQLVVVSDSTLEHLLGPGATAEEALQRYNQWLAMPVFLPDARFLTPDSRRFFRGGISLTPAYWDFLRYLSHGEPRTVLVEGDKAVAVATQNPLIEPLFFRRTEEGWQMDVQAELLHARSLVGYPYAWAWDEVDDEWDAAFHKYLIGPKVLHRFRMGANERLNYSGL